MKKLLSLSLACILALALVACGGNTSSNTAESTAGTSSMPNEDNAEPTAATGPVTVTHGLGETEVEVNPTKIMVGDLGILDILDNVGIEVGGLPTTANLPAFLSQYSDESKYVNMGSMKEVDFETVNEYAPDLILISGRLSASYDELSAIAPTVYMGSDSDSYMAGVEANVELLKQIFPEYADSLEAKLQQLRDDAAELSEAAQASGLNALIVMANDGNISFFSTGSRYGVVYDTFGFTPVAESIEDSTHGAEGSFEFFTEVNPDIIFVIDRSAAIGTDDGDSGAAALLDNALVNSTTAAQEGRVIYLSSDVWYLATGGFTGTAQMFPDCAFAVS